MTAWFAPSDAPEASGHAPGEIIMIAALAFSLVAVAIGFPGFAMLVFGVTNVQ
jgi:hypothetical protein